MVKDCSSFTCWAWLMCWWMGAVWIGNCHHRMENVRKCTGNSGKSDTKKHWLGVCKFSARCTGQWWAGFHAIVLIVFRFLSGFKKKISNSWLLVYWKKDQNTQKETECKFWRNLMIFLEDLHALWYCLIKDHSMNLLHVLIFCQGSRVLWWNLWGDQDDSNSSCGIHSQQLEG